MATKPQQPDVIHTVRTLAELLEISEDDARILMKRRDFPSREVAPGQYVVTQSALFSWVNEGSGWYAVLKSLGAIGG